MLITIIRICFSVAILIKLSLSMLRKIKLSEKSLMTKFNHKNLCFNLHSKVFVLKSFNGSGDKQLLICHYILRKAAYVTKERKGKFETVEITKDQSCLTSYSKPLQLLGIACGNGTTYLVNASNLQVVGKEQNHGFVITGGTISRGGRFITGNFSLIFRNPRMFLQHSTI